MTAVMQALTKAASWAASSNNKMSGGLQSAHSRMSRVHVQHVVSEALHKQHLQLQPTVYPDKQVVCNICGLN